MKRIWAPWRMTYILEKRPKVCIFCDEVAEGKEKEQLLLYRNRCSRVMMNKFPYTCGHLLVAPAKHTDDLDELREDELTNIFLTLRRSVKILNTVMEPHGFNVGMNMGRTAGAGIEDHLHFHIVPRWRGDTNFMPIIADAMVVSESLHETFDRLFPYFTKLPEIG